MSPVMTQTVGIVCCCLGVVVRTVRSLFRRSSVGGARGLVLTLAVLGTMPDVCPQEVSQATRMQEVVRRFVQETGYEVIGLGSWISGKGYQPGISDHDLRLLMPRGTNSLAASEAWATAQQRLTEIIREEFGQQAPGVLSRTNLYPPTQLMQGIQTTEDAIERFVQHQRVPNLGFSGQITSQIERRFVEGLYGPGADAYTQSYEKTAGKLFYRHGGRVYTGLTDLTHLSEGLARYSVAGTANTAAQWALHLEEALRSGGSSATIIKYLQRLETDLVKSRDMARLGSDFPLRNQIRSLIDRLRANPAALATLEDTVAHTARQAGLQAALLRRYENAGTLQRGFLRLAMDGIDAKNALGDMIERVTSKLPDVSAEQVVHGLLLVYATGSTSRALGEGDVSRAFAEGLMPFVGLPPALMVQLTNTILESARESGYEFVAGGQTAFDLIEGIFTGLGRAGTSDRTYTLQQLVESIRTEEGLRSFVWARATEAASRDWGPAGAIHDLGTANAIFQRCYPVILRGWQMQRELLAMELLDLADEVEIGGMVLTYEPNPAELGTTQQVDVTVSVVSLDRNLGKKLTRMRRIMRTLFGPSAGTFVNVHNYWSAGGTDGPHGDDTQVYTFTEAGTYTIELRREISIGAANVPRNHPLLRNITRTSFVDVVVTSREKTPTGPPAVTSDQEPSETSPAEGDFVLANIESHDPQIIDRSRLKDERWTETSFSGTVVDPERQTQTSVEVSWSPLPSVIKPGSRFNLTATGSTARYTQVLLSVTAYGAGGDVKWTLSDHTTYAAPTKTFSFDVPKMDRVTRIVISVSGTLNAREIAEDYRMAGIKATVYHYEVKAK